MLDGGGRGLGAGVITCDTASRQRSLPLFHTHSDPLHAAVEPFKCVVKNENPVMELISVRERERKERKRQVKEGEGKENVKGAN